jgi:hypothetical protein
VEAAAAAGPDQLHTHGVESSWCGYVLYPGIDLEETFSNSMFLNEQRNIVLDHSRYEFDNVCRDGLYLQLVKEAVINGAPPLQNFNFVIPAAEQQYLVLLQVEDGCNHCSDGFNPPLVTGSIHD